VVERNRGVRAAEARSAEAVIEEEIQRFAEWLGSLEVLPTIVALRAHADAIVDGVLEENERRWESLSERDRDRMEALARTVANRLMHEPTLQLKRRARPPGDRVHARIGLLRELFGLEDLAEPAEAREDDTAGADVHELRRRGR